ncbi:50S ribosomal protein L18e [Tardisphaera miroshnichenkoae]
MKRKPTNPEVLLTISALYKGQKPMMKELAQELENGSATRVSVNVGELSKLAKTAKGVAVPGKVLGWGAVEVPMVVAAVSFSRSAKQKIEGAGGKCISLYEFASLPDAPSGWVLAK